MLTSTKNRDMVVKMKNLEGFISSNIVDVSDNDRMFCYAWKFKSNELPGIKFGDTYVEKGQSGRTEVVNRIYESLSVLKNATVGHIQLCHYWDVTEYVQDNCPERFKKGGKIDDYIRRNFIHTRIGNRGDVHDMSEDELVTSVYNVIKKSDSVLPICSLSRSQFEQLHQTCSTIMSNKNGSVVIMAELCARFGKTIWAASVVLETKTKLSIITSYVLNSFSSFEKELRSFEQFKNIEVVDLSKDDDYENKISFHLKNGKQVVAFVSMCPGPNRDERIKTLFSLENDILLIVDEADFGMYKNNQSELLISNVKSHHSVILMTGTNGDRAVGSWNITHYQGVTYPELIMDKKFSDNVMLVESEYIKNFSVNYDLHKNYVDVNFYQMDVSGAVNRAIKHDNDLFCEDGKYLPSWNKAASHPVKAKGFWINMFEGIFCGKHNLDSMNIDLQISRKETTPKVVMFWVSSTTRKENLKMIESIAKESLRNWNVLLISSVSGINGRNVESIVEHMVAKSKKDGRNLLLISACMAQRSFSEGSITELYLAYDAGDSGATIQKVSRTLTPNGTETKVGNVISLSFDPNRDNKFDELILQTALNYKKNKNTLTLEESLNAVLKTVDIFNCSENGSIRFNTNDYLSQAMSRNSLNRIIGRIAPIENLSEDQIRSLANGNINQFKQASQNAALNGKTRDIKLRGKNNVKNKVSKDDYQKAREMAVTISENFDIIYHVCGGPKTVKKCFDIIDNMDDTIKSEIADEFGIEYDFLKYLFLNKSPKGETFINVDMIEFMFAKY